MSDRPMLFSGSMVQAIREGRKTQTRRMVQSRQFPQSFHDRALHIGVKDALLELKPLPCPYGQPGDHLWVRESLVVDEYLDVYYMADNSPVLYNPPNSWNGFHPSIPEWSGVIPSIFMPRWASRITLEIVSVRVELLQDISESDAKAEGSPAINFGDLRQAPMSLLGGKGSALFSSSYRYGFYELWDSINASRGHDWESNPWVWVVEFIRTERREEASA